MIEINGGRNFNNEYQLAKWLIAHPDFEAYVSDGDDIFVKRRAAAIIANIHMEYKLGGSWKEMIERATSRG